MDIKNTSVALYLLLRTGQAPKTPLFVQLARLPLEKNYLSLEFSPDIFHQEYGIGMETPFAVTEAHAFTYLHEKDIIDRYSSYLILYKRFIDDILAIWDGTKDTLLEFLDALNSKAGHIKLTTLAIEAFPFWILSIEKFHPMNCIFLLFKNLLTNICFSLSSCFTLPAIRRQLLREN